MLHPIGVGLRGWEASVREGDFKNPYTCLSLQTHNGFLQTCTGDFAGTNQSWERGQGGCCQRIQHGPSSMDLLPDMPPIPLCTSQPMFCFPNNPLASPIVLTQTSPNSGSGARYILWQAPICFEPASDPLRTFGPLNTIRALCTQVFGGPQN